MSFEPELEASKKTERKEKENPLEHPTEEKN
jgi:hypothetical protein